MKNVLKIAIIPCYFTLLQQGGVSAAEKVNAFSAHSIPQCRLDIESEINREYIKVDIKNNSRISDPYRLITHTLPINVLPLLPTSYRWVKEGDEYVVMKHRSAPDHSLEFVVYADNTLSPTRVNYCTLIDDINVQSFAHTRNVGETFKGKRDSYPFMVQESLLPITTTKHLLRDHFKSTSYIDGHCIDHADTHYPEKVNYHHSSKDIRNHIPEPDRSYWGLHVRNPLVASIRKEGGCYMQLPYYSINSPKTNLGVFVPEGVYFNKFSRNVKNNWVTISSQNSYHIPWDDDIHSPYQTESWTTLLNKKKVDDLTYGYFPNLSHLENKDLKWWEATITNLQSTSPVFLGQWKGYDHMITNNAKIVADWETESINYKLRYLYYSHLENQSDLELRYWHNRTLRHADQLYEFQRVPFNSSQLNEAKYVMSLANEGQQDHWRQIISDQEDFSNGKVQSSAYLRNFGREKKFSQKLNPESDTFSVGKTSTQQDQGNFKVVQFYQGEGSIKLIGNMPPEDLGTINRMGRVLLKGVDLRRVKKWLEVNEKPFRNLNKAEIEIHYEPFTTTSEESCKKIAAALRNAGFNRISRKTQ